MSGIAWGLIKRTSGRKHGLTEQSVGSAVCGPRGSGRFASRVFVWLLPGYLLLLASCATSPAEPEVERLVWPAPPEKPRIKFVRSITSDEDLKKDTTFSEGLLEFLAGEKPRPNRIVQPMGLAVTPDGDRLYVSDFAQSAVFAFDFAHQTLLKIEGLAAPTGIALDQAGNLYVVEQANRSVSLFSPDGTRIGVIKHPSLERPNGIAIDNKLKRIYVADASHTKSLEHTVKIFDFQGTLTGQLGGKKGGSPGQFLFPTYVAVDHDSNVYVTDTLNSRVQMFNEDGDYIRSFGARGNGWGMFDKPKGVALDSFGNVYVADSGWSNVQIFNKEGQVLLFFGGRGPIPGMLKNPTAIAIDGNNTIYVADYINHRVEAYQLVNTQAADSFTVASDDGET